MMVKQRKDIVMKVQELQEMLTKFPPDAVLTTGVWPLKVEMVQGVWWPGSHMWRKTQMEGMGTGVTAVMMEVLVEEESKGRAP